VERRYLEGVSLAGIERIAREILPDDAYAHFSTGAGDELTLRANPVAWSSWSLVPRVLTGSREVSIGVRILGEPAGSPIMVAPMSAQRWAHPDGELATVRAAAAGGRIVVLSMNATEPIERLAAVPGARVWLQVYAAQRLEVTLDLIDRARAAGARAVVLTVDSVLALPQNRRRPLGDPALPDWLPAPMNDGSPLAEDLGWDTVERIAERAGLPLVLKGILREEDARRAIDAGCAGVVVSNHGGRQVDGALPTAEAVGAVAAAAGENIEVYVDGGIRSGTDVLRALALGARAVLVGRPVLWGLAAAGEAGAAHVLGRLESELHAAARESGIADLEAVPSDLVRRSTVAPVVPDAEPVRGR